MGANILSRAGSHTMFRLSDEDAYAYVFAAALVSDARGLTLKDRLNLIDSFPRHARFSDEAVRSSLEYAAETCGIRLSASFWRRVQRNVHVHGEKAEQWMHAGLWVAMERNPGDRAHFERDGPRVLFAFGKAPKADARRVAVLNSRKPGRITPEERWPKVTGDLARKACAEGFDLVSSYGNLPYDLVSHIGNKLGAHVWVVCPDGSPFGMAEGSAPDSVFPGRAEMFDSERTTFVSLLPPSPKGFRREMAAMRDRCVGNLAHEIRVAEIRARGNMEAVGRRALEQGKPVGVFAPGKFGASTGGNRNLLETEGCGNVRRIEAYAHAGLPPLSTPSTCSAGSRPSASSGSATKGEGEVWKGNADAKKAIRAGFSNKARASRLAEPILVHYTRRCNGPWPGQTLEDYLEDVLGGAEDIEHTAFQTLQRILQEGRIRAGHRLIRGSVDTVSFTECEPGQIRRMIRWHSALVRWSFEPCGIVFPKDLLEEMGAVRALYGNDRTYDELDETQKFRFQYLDPRKTDWSREKEWRCKGDLILAPISRDRLRVIVPSDQEAAVIRREYGIERWVDGE